MKIKIFALLFVLILGVACEFKSKNTQVPVLEEKDQYVTGVTGILSGRDLQIGTAACSALQNKFYKFRNLNLEKEFLFQTTTKTCPPALISKDSALLRVSLEDSKLKFKVINNYSGSYFEEIVTADEFTLKYFCPKIVTPSNQDVPNYYDYSMNLRNMIKFKGSVDRPEIEIYYFIKRSETEFSLERKMTMVVDVSKSDLEGNLLEQSLLTICPTLTDYSEFKQVYIP